MQSINIIKECEIVRTPRVMQLEGMFDVPLAAKSIESWEVSLPIDSFDWNIGLIVGPSGCGKTTIAKELFNQFMIKEFAWDQDKAIIDSFPQGMSIKEITLLLSSVGFSSPPSWLRPFHVLSNGEQFRVTMARSLAENQELTVVDEFTSVVDRTVAQIGSAAIAKTVKRRNQRFIAVSCHYDIMEWLQPDWIYEPATNNFQRVHLQRPEINLEIKRVHRSAWQLFKKHHYLSTNLNIISKCFVGYIENNPCAFIAISHFPHPSRSGWRIHRSVVLPDYQGTGLGINLGNYVSSLFKATGKPVRITTSHPAMIISNSKSLNWKMTAKQSLNSAGKKIRPDKRIQILKKTYATNRLTASFEYIGPANPEDAKKFGII